MHIDQSNSVQSATKLVIEIYSKEDGLTFLISEIVSCRPGSEQPFGLGKVTDPFFCMS